MTAGTVGGKAVTLKARKCPDLGKMPEEQLLEQEGEPGLHGRPGEREGNENKLEETAEKGLVRSSGSVCSYKAHSLSEPESCS